MDFLPNHNTLMKYNQAKFLNLTTKLSILSSIVNGVRFLDSINIVHMDLNPNNILISNDLLPKIIDYG